MKESHQAILACMTTAVSAGLIAMALCAFPGCGQARDQVSAVLDATGAHYDAAHCEIFVDKISAARGSHSQIELMLFVKVLPGRLDSSVAEVGFHSKRTGVAQSGSLNHDWKDEPMSSFLGAADYFVTWLPIGSDFGHATYEGAFYVRTLKGITYWLKPAPSANFVFDANVFSEIERGIGVTNYILDIEHAVPTQNRDALRFLNPQRCF